MMISLCRECSSLFAHNGTAGRIKRQLLRFGSVQEDIGGYIKITPCQRQLARSMKQAMVNETKRQVRLYAGAIETTFGASGQHAKKGTTGH